MTEDFFKPQNREETQAALEQMRQERLTRMRNEGQVVNEETYINTVAERALGSKWVKPEEKDTLVEKILLG